MKKRKFKQSERIPRRYRAIIYFYNKMVTAASCYCVREACKIEFTEDERSKLRAADDLVSQAKEIVRGIYSKRIGEAVVQEVWEGV